MASHSTSTRAYFYLILTTSIWGSLYVVSRIVLETVPPLTLLMFRYLIASVALVSISIWRMRAQPGALKSISRKDWATLVLIGLLGYFMGVGAQNIGTKYAGAAVSSLINSTNPVFMVLFAMLFLRERLTPGKLVALVFTLLGAYAILGGSTGGGGAIGILFSFISVILWSLSSIFTRKITQTHDPILVTTIAIFVALLASLPTALAELRLTPHGVIFSGKNIACLLYLGFVCTALPSVLWNKSLSIIEASTCSLFYPIQPLVSVALGILLLGERINARFVFGAVCIVAGLLIAVALSPREKAVKKNC